MDGELSLNRFSNQDIDKFKGTLLEKFLTMSPEDFSRLLRNSPNPLELDTDPRRDAYRYAKVNILFELKTADSTQFSSPINSSCDPSWIVMIVGYLEPVFSISKLGVLYQLD
jgi:hypothetical protein